MGKQKTSVFWVVVNKRVFLLKWHFQRKLGKRYLCSEGNKRTVSLIVLEIFTFFVTTQNHQTLHK